MGQKAMRPCRTDECVESLSVLITHIVLLLTGDSKTNYNSNLADYVDMKGGAMRHGILQYSNTYLSYGISS